MFVTGGQPTVEPEVLPANRETLSQQFVASVPIPPSPTPVIITPTPDDADKAERRAYWEPIIRSAAKQWGANPSLLVKIAECESGFRQEIKNASSSASGLFQFITSTWESQTAKYGIEGDKHDGYVQADLVARMIADGGVTHWSASVHCWGMIQ